MSAVVSNTSNRAPEEEDPEYEEEEEDYEDEEKDGGSGMTALLAGGGGAVALAAIATIAICCCLYGRGSEGNQAPASPAGGEPTTTKKPGQPASTEPQNPPPPVEAPGDASKETEQEPAPRSPSMARSKEAMGGAMGGASGASKNNPKFSGLGVVGVIMMIVAGALYFTGRAIPTPANMPNWIPNPIYIMAGVGAACTLAGMAGCYRGGSKGADKGDAETTEAESAM